MDAHEKIEREDTRKMEREAVKGKKEEEDEKKARVEIKSGEATEEKSKDFWDKISILLAPVGSLFTAIVIFLVGQHYTNTIKDRQAAEMNIRLYSQLMSKREATESALRKDMFKSIIQSFMSPKIEIENKNQKSRFDAQDAKVLSLELLVHNFHESLQLKPLFSYVRRDIKRAKFAKEEQKEELVDRIERVAIRITKKQMSVLEGVGVKKDRECEIEGLEEKPAVEDMTMTLEGITRDFKIEILEADEKNKAIFLRLTITTQEKNSKKVEAEFWLDYFDFPMIDNTYLSHDQRCAVVLTDFDDEVVEYTLIYFPGGYASLKEKPYYKDVVEKLIHSKKQFMK